MAKRMKNSAREEGRLLKDRTLKVRAAMNQGLSTRKDICAAAEITMPMLANLFTKDRELFAEFCVLRKTIVDQASDNIAAIVADEQHPKNYEASKYVLANYKSDLDESMESKLDDDVEFNISQGGASGASPINITFGKKKPSEKE